MWTRDTFVDWPKMPHFCPEHWACLGAIALLAVGLPLLLRGRLSDAVAQRVAFGLASIPAIGYFGWLALAAWYGGLDPRRDLPLEFCSFVGAIAPLAVMRRASLLFDFFYYCTFTGLLGACLTPVFSPSFPHPRAFSFWALHGGAVVTAVYAVAVLGKRPTYRGIFTTMAAVLAILVVVIPVNRLLDANYLYLHQQPPGTLLAVVGPFPGSAPALFVLGLALFHLAYLPFAVGRWLAPQPPAPP